MERIDATILGREYSLACSAEQKEGLLAAVNHVDQRMQNIKNAGKVAGNERIAVMAAIQIAVELLGVRAPDGPLGDTTVGDIKRRLDHMNGLLDQVAGLDHVSLS
ncbi:MAG TPA: cell division protein ZapA [Burkholderiaceae bacterium]|nr:cell division protein ZapA [Burkholderiaceae bacterium]